MDREVLALSGRGAWRYGLGAALVLIGAAPAGALVSWTVSFPDPASVGAYRTGLTAVALAVGADWSRYLRGNAQLDLSITLDASVGRMEGRSLTTSYVSSDGGMQIWEQGAAGEIRHASDPNGSAPDIEIVISPTFLANQMWLDPNPLERTGRVPSARIDAYSALLHEIGHALGFNGWRNAFSAAIGGYGSTFDALTRFDGGDFYFVGPGAMEEYGGPVPLTYGNIYHVGNAGPRPGSDLLDDLMNGLSFARGVRYEISTLDLRMLADIGIPVEFPESPAPGTGVCVIGGIATLARRRR